MISIALYSAEPKIINIWNFEDMHVSYESDRFNSCLIEGIGAAR